MQVNILRCQKREAGRTRSEDAAGGHVPSGVFAMSDGAGTGSYAREWASVLVNHAMEKPLRSDVPAEVSHWLGLARVRFVKEVPPVDPATVPPYQRGTLRRGAFATFLQVRFVRHDDGCLAVQCLSLGDTCAFLLRVGSERREMHPQMTDLDFDRSPHLLTTVAAEFNPYVRVLEKSEFSDLRPGDVLVAATDAVARWIVGHRDDQDALSEMLSIPNDERWSQWVEQQRDLHAIGNDDSTLMVLRVVKEDDMANLPSPVWQPEVERLEELEVALQRGDSSAIAEAWGDGSAIAPDQSVALKEQVDPHLRVFEAVQHMRSVMNAYHQEFASIGDVEQQWGRWREFLIDRPAGAGIRRALEKIGITIDRQELDQ